MNTVTIILMILILLLICVIFMLTMKNYNLKDEVKKSSNTNQKIDAISILQDFISIAGNNLITSKEKIRMLNEKLLEKYKMKYSTIVIFNGNKYCVQASNVNEQHWPTFERMHNQDIFMESIKNASPIYITSKQGEKLPYLEMEFERAKAAMFFPMYVDNVYIGFWLIEGSQPHEFDKVDTTVLENVKSNLIWAIEASKSQRIVENMVRIDKITGVYTYQYLFGEPRKVIDKYPSSIVSLIKISNLVQIEEKTSKQTADNTLSSVVKYINTNLSPEYYCTMYFDNIIAVVFSGSDMEGVSKFLEDAKADIEKLRIKTVGCMNTSMNGLAVAPKLNIVSSKYYKETPLDEVLQRLYKSLDRASAEQSSISTL